MLFLSQFTLKRHFLVHANMLSTSFLMRKMTSSLFTPSLSREASSANLYFLARMAATISETMKINSKGDMIDPWGSPSLALNDGLVMSPTLMFTFLANSRLKVVLRRRRPPVVQCDCAHSASHHSGTVCVCHCGDCRMAGGVVQQKLKTNI